MFSRSHKSIHIVSASFQGLLVLCLALGTVCRANAATTSVQKSSNLPTGFKSNFAIADFDGDRKPDLATVEVQTGSSASSTRYSIRLQLTAGAAQVFGVIAPAGGLQIVARDVNGDDALDVLVSTTLQHTRVAVLLNDGHGKFTLANPAAFPAVLWGNEEEWNSGALSLCDSPALVRIEYPASELDRQSKFEGPQVQLGAATPSAATGSLSRHFFSALGRAPPASSRQS